MSKKPNLTGPAKTSTPVAYSEEKEEFVQPSIRIVKVKPLPDGTFEDADVCYKTELSAGVDLCAVVEGKMSLMANRVDIIRTGVRLLVENWEDEPNYVTYASLEPRSSLRKEGISFLGSGIIDLDYTGEILILATLHKAGGVYCLMSGMAIGQLVFHKAYRPEGIKIANVARTGGFGSTGR